MVKYFCDKCAKEKKLITKFRKTRHVCDFCGEEKNCNDDKVAINYKKGKK